MIGNINHFKGIDDEGKECYYLDVDVRNNISGADDVRFLGKLYISHGIYVLESPYTSKLMGEHVSLEKSVTSVSNYLRGKLWEMENIVRFNRDFGDVI